VIRPSREGFSRTLKEYVLEKLLALLKVLKFPFRFGKLTVHVEDGKATRYEMTESVKL